MSVPPNCGPDPASAYPLAAAARVGFLNALVSAPNVEIGDYTYYDDPEGPQGFLERCVLYHYPHMGDRLVIGRFCAIATGVRFIMNGANHALDGLSTYPFSIFGAGWDDPATDWAKGSRGDTVVGDDVWIGTGAVILPGVTIGAGAVIGAFAVVSRDVPPYGVAVGNPARVVKRRFDDATVERLLDLRWWDCPAERLTAALPAICTGDVDPLAAVARPD